MTAPQGPSTTTTAESTAPPPAVIEDVSTSSDEEIPWDQRRSPDSASVDSSTFLAQEKAKGQSTVTGTTMAGSKKEKSKNEISSTDPIIGKNEGDLDDRPQTPTRAGWLLRTGLPQQRPLQPPSLRGLTARERIAAATPSESEVQKQWNFWSQLDEDGPEDEVAAMQSEDESEKNKNRQKMERALGHDQYEGELDHRSTAEDTIEYSMDGTKSKDAGGGADDFCGGTLTAINEMCGGGLAQTGSTDGPTKRQQRRAAPLHSDDQQEYTAIEVEFVEANAPSQREDPPEQDSRAVQDAVDVLSDDGDSEDGDEARTQPDGKRAVFLSALARKAKADFDRAKTARQKMETHEAIESKHSSDSVEEDIYVSFTASEKRKFLKLINTGHAPMEASRKIMEARAEKEAAQKKKKEQAAYRKNRRNKRLAFWKKNRPKATVPMPSPSYSRSGDELEANEDPAYDDDDREEEVSASEDDADFTETKTEDMIPDAAMSAMIALDTKTPRHVSPAGVKATSGGDKSDEERFARSGINYYDAVRRETSDTDDDFGQIGTSPGLTSSEKKKRRMRPRGFSALREGVRSRSVPKPRIPESMFEEADSEPVSKESRGIEAPKIMPSKSSDPVLESAPSSDNDRPALASPMRSLSASQPETESSRASSLPVPMRLDLGPSIDEDVNTPVATGRGYNGTESRPRGRVVADVGKTKIGKEDEEMLARIEREILRVSVTPKSQQSTQTAKSPARVRSASTPKTRPRGDNELLTEEEKQQNESELILDVGLDTYMQAADVYSAVQNDPETPHNDATSVYTAGTSGTHSRRRRPGAAKTRLAKAKQLYEMQSAKKKGFGWHESIQAAAAGTGRVWKPGTGWVDYVETPEHGLPSSNDGERIELNLSKALTKKEPADMEKPESPAVHVPFPKDWEAEREQMLAAGESTPKKWPMDSSPSRAVIQDDMGVEHLVEPMDVLADVPPTSPEKPEAPEELMQFGEKPRRNRRKSSPARTRMAQPQEKATGWVASMQAATAALKQDGRSWNAESGWSVPEEEQGLIDDVVDFNPPLKPGPIDVLRDSPPPTPAPHSSHGPDGKLTQWVEKSGRVVKPESSTADMSMSERAVASGASVDISGPTADVDATGPTNGAQLDPYVQISETGAVRAHKLNAQGARRGTQLGHDEAHAPGESLGAFPTVNDLPASAVVDIQKIDEEDLNLFPEDSRETRALQARTPPRVKSTAIGGRSPPAVTSASSGDSSRRGRGPVDIDEVDDTWDSDDDNRFSLGWDSKSGSNSVNSKPAPSPSKAIPKLKGSKRDTSPIRAHRLAERPGPEADVLSDISSSKPDMSDRDWRRQSARGADVKLRLHEWESRAAADGPQEWPSESDEVSHNDRGKPVAEWKSFMGKKVSAETEAASQQRARDRAIQDVRSEDEDSLFTFEEKKQSNVASGEKYNDSLTPLEARMYTRDHLKDGDDNPESDVYGSEGYGPTPQDGRTFLQRLSECAAPVVASAKNTVGDLPSAHLAFMRNGQFSPAKTLGCGKPGDLDDAEEDLVESKPSSDEKLHRSSPKSSPKGRRAGSSVASEDFGAKTAYLEAIAMKAAVSKPRRTSSRAGSSVASSSVASNHSEKWKSFLERKKASGVSPAKGRPSSHVSNVSKAAERYAASKVEEMMAEMNADPASSPHGRIDSGSPPQYSDDVDDDHRALQSYRSRENRGGSRVGAAEDLAAARVEAMMSQLSGGVEMEEGEI